MKKDKLLLALNKRILDKFEIGFELQDYFGKSQLNKFITDYHRDRYDFIKDEIEAKFLKRFKKYKGLEINFSEKGLDYELTIS